jgi:predicted HTH transcriptional regulator
MYNCNIDKLSSIVDNSMENTRKENPSILNTVLTLGGILAGAFLITKLLHGETDKHELNKKVINTSKPLEKLDHLEIKKKDTILNGLNSRQNKILAFAREKGVVSPKDLQKLVPGVSSRTLRRDMDTLTAKKYILQKGNTKSTYYEYIKNNE